MLSDSAKNEIAKASETEMIELGYIKMSRFTEAASRFYALIADWTVQVTKNADACKNSSIIVFTKSSIATLRDSITKWLKDYHG